MILVSSIYDEVSEVTGLCDQTKNFRAITRGVELLSNEGLFDPQIGQLDFSTNDSYFVALPRDVKTVLRVNVNTSPTFFRNRLFEFSVNGEGNDDGERIGWSWADKGYLPIQDERKLPGRLAYVCENAADVGKAITVTGKDINGSEIKEELIAGLAPSYGELEFYEVKLVVREETARMTTLLCNTDALVAQYYPDETVPMYRVIKLSRKVAAVRILFRRDVLEVRSMEDVIPLHSKMAVIHAAKAVRYFAGDEIEKGTAALAMAVDFIKKEQQSRDEQDAMAGALELPSIIDNTINSRDGIIVADVYPMASDIFGPIGRARIFDKITTAIEVLGNKAHWDSRLGVVDLWMTDRSDSYVADRRGHGHGYFVLPRFVETVVSLNLCGQPTMPRNRWFEFHMNGSGESGRADCGAWDDAGEVCVTNWLPVDPDTRRTIPSFMVAVPDLIEDTGNTVTIFGWEELIDGTIAEVYRNGKPGYTLTISRDQAPAEDAPKFVRFSRIVKEVTAGFVRFIVSTGPYDDLQLGYWYPDEIEPKYRAIKVASSKAKRIRILYRKRTPKVTSLYEPIPLRSRLAIENMLRALKVIETDPQAAAMYEAMAVNYLSEERINSSPSDTPMLQFDEGTMPGFSGNIT